MGMTDGPVASPEDNKYLSRREGPIDRKTAIHLAQYLQAEGDHLNLTSRPLGKFEYKQGDPESSCPAHLSEPLPIPNHLFIESVTFAQIPNYKFRTSYISYFDEPALGVIVKYKPNVPENYLFQSQGDREPTIHDLVKRTQDIFVFSLSGNSDRDVGYVYVRPYSTEGEEVNKKIQDKEFKDRIPRSQGLDVGSGPGTISQGLDVGSGSGTIVPNDHRLNNLIYEVLTAVSRANPDQFPDFNEFMHDLDQQERDQEPST
ncbi:hypothetical protein HY388_02190 [Candidatus Daviesbacteria bacterium]|nr:hypothetical protein [Candidatus Daviesbacteria bacterium]